MNFRRLLTRAAVAASLGVLHLATPPRAAASEFACVICLEDHWGCLEPGHLTMCLNACDSAPIECRAYGFPNCSANEHQLICGMT